MLSRVASNIYWMGRYVERAEHLARYTKVQYFSMHDAPHLIDINFVLTSIVIMTGIDHDFTKDQLNEQDILFKVGIDKSSNASIYSFIFMARENARNSRNALSDELWEMINQYYLEVQEFDISYFKTRGLYEFTQMINKHSHLIKSTLNHTLLHEFSWMLISLGIHIERTLQIIRTVKSKLSDIKILREYYDDNKVLEEYQWTTTLKIIEAFDIYRRYIRRLNHDTTPLKFIIGHKTFPRSIVYNLGKINDLIDRMNSIENEYDTLKFQSDRIYNKAKNASKEDLEDFDAFMDILLEEVELLHTNIDRIIFSRQNVTGPESQLEDKILQ